MKKISLNNKKVYYLVVFIIIIAAILLIIFIVECFIDSANTKNIWITRLSISGVIITAFGAFEASRAQRKSNTILVDLIKMGFLNAPRESFNDIFKNDLIPNLLRIKNHKDGKIYLLLSTPAYGYPVIENNTYKKFKESLFDLKQSGQIEFMFFCPDSHFDYWSNVILWAITYDDNFAIKFAKEIYIMLNEIETSNDNWRLFLKREVTIRLYGFIFRSDSTNAYNKNFDFDKVYVCFVDPFNIALSQLEISKARHMQIHPRNINEYVGEKDSFFERIKQCPYTMLKGKETSKDDIKLLIIDYLFGLTSDSKNGDYVWFKKQFDIYFKNLKDSKQLPEKYKEKNDEELLLSILKIIITYYEETIKYLNVKKLDYGISISHHLTIFNAIKNKIDEFFPNRFTDFYKNIEAFNNVVNQDQIKTTKTEVDTFFSDSQNNNTDKIIFCIFHLLCAGFNKSVYFEKLTKRK